MQTYNLHERINLTLAGCQKIMTSDRVKFVSNRDTGSCITYSDIHLDVLNERIKSEIDYYNQLALSFKWFTYNTDKPDNLGISLLENGFTLEDESSFMVLDLEMVETSDDIKESDFVCIEVSDEQGIKDAIAVQKQVWGRDTQVQASDLIRLKQESPEQIRVYVSYQDNQPVSSAWLMCQPASPFASIWSGSTLLKYRGKGIYSALLTKRIEDAKRLGLKYLSIHASKMSRPIVEKFGFKFVATMALYQYELARN